MSETYCEECQNLSDKLYAAEDAIVRLRSARRRLRYFAAAVVLVAVAAVVAVVGVAFGATWPLLAPNGTRRGEVREQSGTGAIDIFDAESNREGWGRRNRDGTVELFDKDGRRTGAMDRNGVLRTYEPQKGRW